MSKNFHSREQKIQLLQGFRGLNEITEIDTHDSDDVELNALRRKDKKAKACIDLTL